LCVQKVPENHIFRCNLTFLQIYNLKNNCYKIVRPILTTHLRSGILYIWQLYIKSERVISNKQKTEYVRIFFIPFPGGEIFNVVFCPVIYSILYTTVTD